MWRKMLKRTKTLPSWLPDDDISVVKLPQPGPPTLPAGRGNIFQRNFCHKLPSTKLNLPPQFIEIINVVSLPELERPSALQYGKIVPPFIIFPLVSSTFLTQSKELKRMAKRTLPQGLKAKILNVKMEEFLNFRFWLILRLESTKTLKRDLQSKESKALVNLFN